MKKMISILACTLLVSFAFAADENKGMDEGLANAKIIVPAGEYTIPAQTIATAYVKAADYAPEGGYGDKDYQAAYENMMMNGFAKLQKWMEESKCHPNGPGFAVWFEDPSEAKPGELTSKAGFPVDAACEPNIDVIIETVTEGPGVSITYGGDYKDAGNAWHAIMKWASDKGWELAGSPVEIFVKGPNDTKDPSEYVTQIVWRVKAPETMEENTEDGKE